MVFFLNWDTQKHGVFITEIASWLGWFEGTTILGNLHVCLYHTLGGKIPPTVMLFEIPLLSEKNHPYVRYIYFFRCMWNFTKITQFCRVFVCHTWSIRVVFFWERKHTYMGKLKQLGNKLTRNYEEHVYR